MITINCVRSGKYGMYEGPFSRRFPQIEDAVFWFNKVFPKICLWGEDNGMSKPQYKVFCSKFASLRGVHKRSGRVN